MIIKISKAFKIHKAKLILFVFALALVFFVYKNYTGGITRFITVMATGVEPIYKIDTKSKEVYLTFNINDADPKYVGKVIKILDIENIRGVFFACGQWVERHEQTVNEIVKKHDLGNMGYSFDTMNKKTEEYLIDEIKKTEKLFKSRFSLDINMFRPPFGQYDRRLVEAADLLGYKIILAEIEINNGKYKSPEKVIKHVLKNIEKGAIISFDCNSVVVVESLPKIIKQIKNRGFEFIPLSAKISGKDSFSINGFMI
ncbi:MAG: peptidoglycan-N-acetylmuramic acid deacetylase [Thermosediminibacterales bacterium]|nr:peptidoglycan-N-acetylmuramic acid deacetylase [Thermosediminibacterales bacterium]